MDIHHQTLPLIGFQMVSHSSTWVGEGLCLEILQRLPAKSLCRFRCVCKSWNSLVSSTFFIKLRYSLSSSATPPHLKPYLRVDVEDYSPQSYALCRPHETLDEHIRIDLHFPFRIVYDTEVDFTFVGVIHGVVCVSHSLESAYDSTILWNPAIHMYVMLPLIPFPLNVDTTKIVFSDPGDTGEKEVFVGLVRFHCNAIGFGYDSSSDDFKVVRVWIPDYSMERYNVSPPPIYEVYSAREGLWSVAIAENMRSCRFNLTRWRVGCFMNGIIHWLISKLGIGPHFVLMFDCENEKFTTMELPVRIYQTGVVMQAKLLEYAGMLSVLVDLEFQIELWVMEEYGVTSSWKKLYRIPNNVELKLEDIDVCQPSFRKLVPYGPNQWIKSDQDDNRFQQISSGHVYEESMFLMDVTEALSYRNEEIVDI